MDLTERLRSIGAETPRCRIHCRRDSREARLDAIPRDREIAHDVGVQQREHGPGEQQSGTRAGEPLYRRGDPLIECTHRQQHADGEHGSRDRIAEREQLARGARDAARCQARGISDQQGNRDSKRCTHRSDAKAVPRPAGEARELELGAGSEQAHQQHDGNHETDRERHHAHQCRESGTRTGQRRFS